MRLPHILALLSLPVLAMHVGCQSTEAQSSARRITTRHELIGGPSALGEVGDFLLENNRIRVVIQDKGFSRGFGIYGGGLIDVDQVRAVDPASVGGGNGRDQFGELFPIAFLQALEPTEVSVLSDGSDGGSAKIKVSGEGNDLITLTKVLNQVLLNSHELPDSLLEAFSVDNLNGAARIRHQIIYELKPDARHLEINVSLENISEEDIEIPSAAAGTALGLFGISAEDFNAPLGMVALFGAGNDIFVPGTGYNVRYGLEDAYLAGAALPFPALPGLVAPGVMTTSTSGVSYGLFADLENESDSFVKNRLDENGDNVYEVAYNKPVDKNDILIPFVASAFTGLFSAQTPNVLPAGESAGFKMLFVVGDGDASSVLDVFQALKKIPHGELVAEVFDLHSLTELHKLSVVAFDDAGRAVNQFFTDRHGRFSGDLPVGRYTLKVEREPVVSEAVAIEITEGDTTLVRLGVPGVGRANVRVYDDGGQNLPAKVTVVGISPADAIGGEIMRRKYQFDLSVGQHWRHGDLIPDDPDRPSTRRFIESSHYTHDGLALIDLAPNQDWVLYVSRGPEYEIETISVNVEPGEIVQIGSQLKRIIDTRGYLSGDFHLHAKPSLDSSLAIDERVRSVAGEGVELLVSTDHNFVTDYRPVLDELGLNAWATSMVGLEMTTLESGHFNGFPLSPVVGAITKGAFEWSRRPPDELFDEVRALGAIDPENTLIQVNHPRDSILGYFEQYGLDPLTGTAPEPIDCSVVTFSNLVDCALASNGPAFKTADGMTTFSFNFDAIEVFNGSVIGSLHSKRMPESIAGLELPEEFLNELPQPGQILCEDGDVAHPGALDDWFNLLNQGHRYIGMGTSDSHRAHDHTGAGRTYFYVGHDDPSRLTDQAVVDALRTRRVAMSSGPFIEMFVDDKPMGSEVRLEGETAQIRVVVRAPTWMDVDEVRLWLNGEVHSSHPLEFENYEAQILVDVELSGDSWVVAEARGDESMFPLHAPVDQPPVLLGDALAAFAGPLGFGASGLGDLAETNMGPMLAYGITNPIWLNIGDDVYEAPGPLNRICEGFGVITQKSSAPVTRLPRGPKARVRHTFGLPKVRGDILDVRTIFDQFGRHQH